MDSHRYWRIDYVHVCIETQGIGAGAGDLVKSEFSDCHSVILFLCDGIVLAICFSELVCVLPILQRVSIDSSSH